MSLASAPGMRHGRPVTSTLSFRSWDTLRPGPRLIVLGGVHGDETCGTRALEALEAEIDAGALVLERGVLTLVPRANPLACAQGTRAGERNLNRSFVPRPAESRQDYEDHVVAALAPVLAAHDVLLDLHSATSDTVPFVMIELAEPDGVPFRHAEHEAALAGALGLDVVVEGWQDVYEARLEEHAERAGVPVTPEDRAVGTGTNEYLRERGGWALTVECGGHDDPEAFAVALTVTRRALAHLGLVAAPQGPHATAPAAPGAAPRVLRTAVVVDKEDQADRFVRPWQPFEPVRTGDLIGVRADGTEVRASVDGAIMFPDDDADPGEEWFYLAVTSDRPLG